MMDEWISLNEYMRRYKVGYAVVKRMIANKELEVRETPRRAVQNTYWRRHCIKSVIRRRTQQKN